MATAKTDPSTYKLNHTMMRVVSSEATIGFYEKHFGMKVIDKHDGGDFTLYFLSTQTAEQQGVKNRSQMEGLLELTVNHGFDGKYATGNEKGKQGFSHICMACKGPLEDACAKLEKNGVKFVKKPEDGRQHDIAFVEDVDGYRIELISAGDKLETDWVFNHTCLRVKDIAKSREFYETVLGMTLLRIAKFPDAKFDLYFYGYGKQLPAGEQVEVQKQEGVNPLANTAGLVELTYNYEMAEGQSNYRSGNEDDSKGFGHLAVSVDDIQAACDRFDAHGATWQKKLTDGKMKHIAFVKDADGYWIEVIPTSK